MKTYLKALVHVLATVLAALVPLFTGNENISPTEWVNVAILGVGTFGVYLGPNVPGAPYTKSVLAVLTAVLTVLASAIIGGINPSEWFQIGVAALGALGVYATPNKPPLYPATDKLDSAVV